MRGKQIHINTEPHPGDWVCITDYLCTSNLTLETATCPAHRHLLCGRGSPETLICKPDGIMWGLLKCTDARSYP